MLETLELFGEHSQLIKISGKFTFNVVLMLFYLLLAFLCFASALMPPKRMKTHAHRISIKSKLGTFAFLLKTFLPRACFSICSDSEIAGRTINVSCMFIRFDIYGFLPRLNISSL